MYIRKPLFALAVAAAAMLVGCNGLQGQPLMPSHVGPEARASSGLKIVKDSEEIGDLYVSAFEAYIVSDYRIPDGKNRKPYCSIFGQLQVTGIGVDSSGTLWIPGVSYAHSLVGTTTSYRPHCGKEGITLHDTAQPIGIAFDASGRNYVLNYAYNDSHVDVFEPGKASPSRELFLPTSDAAGQGEGIGTDSMSDVFVTFNTYYQSGERGQVVEYVGGKSPAIALPAAAVSGYHAGIIFDKRNKMLIVELSSDGLSSKVDVWSPPYTGNPKSFPLKGVSFQCSLGPKEHTIACANTDSGTVDLYSYPKMQYKYSIGTGLHGSMYVYGVAYDPSAPL